ncbi:MAG: DNA polymerase I, partial [bacterium]|nr:DNA polymerase I [bacterium]
MQRLVLIDGNAILHRAYHALPPLTNRSGELVNAVYGFSMMLLKVVDDLKPEYLAVVFDTSTPTFRKMEYLGYQAHRPVMDEELSGQIEKVYEVVEAFGIPIYAVPGFEADDVIGTLA